MDELDIRKLLVEANTIAVVGASSNPEKASYGIMRKLMSVGYRVFPVNPRETEILGQKVYPSLDAIPEKIDIVNVFRRAEDTPPIADEAVKVGAGALWLQQGISNEDAFQRARSGGLSVVMDACIATLHAVLQVPKKTGASY